MFLWATLPDGYSSLMFTLTGEEMPVGMEPKPCIEEEDPLVALKDHHLGTGHSDLLHPWGCPVHKGGADLVDPVWGCT